MLNWGAPICGTDSFFASSVSKRVNRILVCQDQLPDLDVPQVELHLLHSCLGLCKLNHIIRTVPMNKISEELVCFDASLCCCLEILSRSSISDIAWLQSTLPIHLGGHGKKAENCS